MRLSLKELEQRCRKPAHPLCGNWFARNISRPMALRVIWVVQPWRVTAHQVTALAWIVGLGAVGALSWGNWWGWILAGVMLQVWYLLDHVDGQLARFHGTASLDGVQLDYLMHHSLQLLLPIGTGYGVADRLSQPVWIWGG